MQTYSRGLIAFALATLLLIFNVSITAAQSEQKPDVVNTPTTSNSMDTVASGWSIPWLVRIPNWKSASPPVVDQALPEATGEQNLKASPTLGKKRTGLYVEPAQPANGESLVDTQDNSETENKKAEPLNSKTTVAGASAPPLEQFDSHKSETPASTGVRELLEVQAKIKSVLPQVLPAVVSVEGGSGVIVSPDGLVLSASHVTKNANRRVRVMLSDGRSVEAKTLGVNKGTDTAALKILSPGPWPHIELDDASEFQAGQWCLAIGYPLSFRRDQPAAVRLGRITSFDKDRFVTDCTIMGGDSGGALVNLEGKLIAISSRVKPNVFQNLHVQIASFESDWEELIAGKEIDRPQTVTRRMVYLGVQGESDFGFVRVKSVRDGSPAQRAGIQSRDVIVELDGQVVQKFDQVLNILTQKEPGDQIDVAVNRFGQIISLQVELGGSN